MNVLTRRGVDVAQMRVAMARGVGQVFVVHRVMAAAALAFARVVALGPAGRLAAARASAAPAGS
jgi:hypothetical protein